jgi:hypothetical protein
VSTQLGVREIFRVEKWSDDFGSSTPKLLMAGHKTFWVGDAEFFFLSDSATSNLSLASDRDLRGSYTG